MFGFSKKKAQEKTDEEKEVQLVLFKGALSGNEPDMSANAQITKVGLTPAKQIITDGLLRRAEMIRIDPKGDRAAVTLFIDGVPCSGSRLSKQHALAVTQVVKLLCGLDVKTRRKPQAGGVRIELRDRPYELHVDVQPVPKGGERLVMRIRNRSDDDRTPE